MRSTTQILGYEEHTKLLIINADDYGMCHDVNRAVHQLLQEDVISSSTIMMPCPWAHEAAQAAAKHPIWNVGIHLTLTSEWEHYKWGPVNRQSSTASLVTKHGYFPENITLVEQHAEDDEVRAELRSQIESALSYGIQPTHLDNHMGSVYGLATGRSFLHIVFDLCQEYGLPFRLPKAGTNVPPELESVAHQWKLEALERGVLILDDLISLPYSSSPSGTYDELKCSMSNLLRGIRSGVTELIIHPAKPSAELQSITSDWPNRGYEYELFRDPAIQALLHSEQIKLIHWRDMREAQRLMSAQA